MRVVKRPNYEKVLDHLERNSVFFIWRLCYQISVQGVHSEEIFETLPEFRNRRILTIHALLILHY